MDNNQMIALEESNKMEHYRQQLAEYIFHESQEGEHVSSSSLYKAVSHEISNISDKGIEIILKQKNKEAFE
ncbi:hypothetical protein [Niallia oryzisoli]|uniref:hypothetical protein n=1 Tax=Niallia oryzisoli TaxID=1737571 RepID=UPI003736BC0F